MNGAAQSKGWVDTFDSKVNLGGFLKNFNIKTVVIVETVAYFSVGVFSGFIIKNYLKPLLVMALVYFLLLKGLEYVGIGVMVLNWEKVRMIVGMGSQDTLDSLARMYFLWMQTHVRQVVSWVFGFLVGIRLL